MEQIVKISPSFDKRDSDPKKNYGIHNAEMFMTLKGELGAVVFSIFTGWYLPHLDRIERGRGATISYHGPKPLHDYEANNPHENCEWIGGTCYGDTGYTVADTVFDILVSEGSDAVWKWLENYYKETFGELK